MFFKKYVSNQDYSNVRRGIRNCLWLQSTNNLCEAREDEELRIKKEKAKAARGKRGGARK